MKLIKQHRLDLEQVLANPVSAYAFGVFEIDSVPPLTLLLQTGYLTIKSSETIFNKPQYRLDFPNREVSEFFNVYLLNAYAKSSQNEVANLLEAKAIRQHTGAAGSFFTLKQYKKIPEVFSFRDFSQNSA